MYSMVDPYLQAGRTVEWKQLIDNALFKSTREKSPGYY